MTFDEESAVAQRVLAQLAGRGDGADVRGAQVEIGGVGYSVHRHGASLRFNQRTNLWSGEVGRYLVVDVGQHLGGWMIARSVRPPGEYHDERAAEAARRIVEHALVQLGYDVGTSGREGRKKTAREIEADVWALSGQPVAGEVVRRSPARRTRRRASGRTRAS